MTSGTFLKVSFGLMVFALVSVAWLTFNLTNFPQVTMFGIAQLFSLPFMVTAIVELNSSNRIDRKEKAMWTFGFIAMTLITGILYFISERKRVILN